MAKNEDGEFELILGNRQLISVFLIVVILLGVFFAMGYIVGRNSAPAVAEGRDNKVSAAQPSPRFDPLAPETTRPAENPPATPETASAERTPTHAARDIPEPAPSKAPPPEEKPKPTASRAAEPPPASVTGDPAPGEYWQVVATARPDAEIITEALTKKGFHAVMAPAPKGGVFRVLVGPLKDSSTQAQTRTALEAAGFKNPIVRKY